MGDSLGGLLIVVADRGIIDLDGQSGSIVWQETNLSFPLTSASVGQDGSILTADNNNNLVKINPQSGQPVPAYNVPVSVGFYQTGVCIDNAPVVTGSGANTTVIAPSSSMVDAQGNVFFTISYYTASGSLACVEGDSTGGPSSSAQYYSLVKLDPNGQASLTNLPISGPVVNYPYIPTVLAPDGNGGALVTWSTGQYPNTAISIMASSTSSVYPSSLPNGVSQLVQAENSNAFATDGLNVVAFAPLTGTVNGNYQSPQGVSSMSVEHTGGISIVDNQMEQIHLDANANPSVPTLLSSNGSQIQPSLINTWYGLVGPAGSAPTTVASISNEDFNWGDSPWAFASTLSIGSVMGGQTAKTMPEVALLPLAQLPSCQNVKIPCANEQLENALSGLQTLLSQACTTCQTHVFGISQLSLSQPSFYSYLKQGHKFYDATRSSEIAGKVVCTFPTILHPFPPQCGLSALQSNTPLNVLWQQGGFGAISKTPSPQGAVIAFDPAQVCGSASATASVCQTLSTSQALQFEEGTLFHESLHGETDLFDSALKGVFGICSNQTSGAITEYLNFWIFGLGTAPTTPKNQTCTQWP